MDAVQLYDQLEQLYAPRNPDSLVERESAVRTLLVALRSGVPDTLITERMRQLARRKTGFDSKLHAHILSRFWLHQSNNEYVYGRFNFNQQ